MRRGVEEYAILFRAVDLVSTPRACPPAEEVAMGDEAPVKGEAVNIKREVVLFCHVNKHSGEGFFIDHRHREGVLEVVLCRESFHKLMSRESTNVE